ncbi:transferase [Flavobacterium sp.]|uniref:acyltransferase n=1 Tax=Flavobacterium sp. TaxID=239 RepID=UPI00286A6065|nr:transferase [Flavobacterium sp.]
MIKLLKNIYRKLRSLHRLVKLYYSVNWTKTIYFNLRKFPFEIALKLPVFFYGKIKFQSLKGEVIINGTVKRGMIGYGQRFELFKKEKGNAEIFLRGKIVFNGNMHIGKDVSMYIGENAYCEFGYMSCLGSDVKIICTDEVIIGDWARIGYESQIVDTNSHPMKNSFTGEDIPITAPVRIGTHNSISNRVSIRLNTKTPDYCVVGSNSLCNKDYSNLGNNILLAGIPAKLIKKNYTRDWDKEKELLESFLIII